MTEVISAIPSPLATLNFKPIIKDELKPTRKLTCTLQDVYLPEDSGISPVACSEPFPLFAEEATQTMRQEIFTAEPNAIFRYAPFMDQAWNDPKSLEFIYKVAGVDLIPNIQYKVGNINISIQNAASDKTKEDANNCDITSVPKWPYNAFPCVCVVMMSHAWR